MDHYLKNIKQCFEVRKYIS